MFRTWTLPLALFAFTCPDNGDVPKEWVQFNGDEDIVVLEVTKDGPPGDDVVETLLSTTGESEIGDVTVSPGSGPVGTEHRFTIDLLGAYGSRVKRVEVEVDAGDRGSWTFEMTQDSANEEVWVADLTSYGAPGETREDSFTFVLYELVEVEEAVNDP